MNICWLLMQIPAFPEAPKSATIDGYFPYICTLLLIAITSGIGFLYKLLDAERKETRDVNDENKKILRQQVDYAQGVITHLSEKVVEKLGVIALNDEANHKVLSGKLDEIAAELRRKAEISGRT